MYKYRLIKCIQNICDIIKNYYDEVCYANSHIIHIIILLSGYEINIYIYK